jgi:hypothetical protein
MVKLTTITPVLEGHGDRASRTHDKVIIVTHLGGKRTCQRGGPGLGSDP